MKYSYTILICTLSILLYGCSSSTFVNGLYSGHNPHVFIFSENSTFRYEHRGVWYSESTGTFRKKNNMIFLNSFEQRTRIPLEYTKVENVDNEMIIDVKVNVVGRSEKDYICFPYVNGKSVFIDTEKGSYSFHSEVSVDSIYFLVAKRPFVLRGTGYKMGYDDIKTEIIYPHLYVGENLNVTINIIDSLFGYKVFNDEKLDIKKGKIIFKEKGKNNKLYLKE